MTLNKIITYTKKMIKDKQCNNENEYYELMKSTFSIVKNKYPSVTLLLMSEIFSNLFNKMFVQNLTSVSYFPDYLDLYPPIDIPDEYKHLEQHFQKLKALPQPVQRSKEWFEYRHNRITASDTAAAIDENPYEPVESFILKKCDPDFKFLDNMNVYHGKKFELIATKIYECIYNNMVFEFGALPSEKYAFLGASPDGICSSSTLDGKFSSRLGTMLEIKCVAPFGRTIETSGNIKGHICPYYYYLQVQQQLECCELEVCDFWQCKLIEYKTREEYLIDSCMNTVHTYDNDSKKMSIDNRIKKGVLLQFYPKHFVPEFDGDNIEWKSKFIYPPTVCMTAQQYDEWVATTMSTLNIKHQDIMSDFYFHKIIYWKLEQSHNMPIKRDRKLFASILPILEETWKQVDYYRNNIQKLEDLKKIVDKRKKFYKIDTDFLINNDIIKNKVLFLNNDKNIPTKKKINKSKNKNESDKEDDNTYKKTIKINKKIESNDSDNSDDCDFIDDEPKKPIKMNNKPLNKIQKTVTNDSDDCDFIDDEPKKPIKMDKIQKKVNNDSDDCDFIDDEPKKPIKNNKEQKFVNKKLTKFKKIENNNSDECDFID